jgi:hypothetical protein
VSRSAATRLARFNNSLGTLRVMFWLSATQTSVTRELVDAAFAV